MLTNIHVNYEYTSIPDASMNVQLDDLHDAILTVLHLMPSEYTKLTVTSSDKTRMKLNFAHYSLNFLSFLCRPNIVGDSFWTSFASTINLTKWRPCCLICLKTFWNVVPSVTVLEPEPSLLQVSVFILGVHHHMKKHHSDLGDHNPHLKKETPTYIDNPHLICTESNPRGQSFLVWD